MPASSFQQQKLRVCEVCSAYLGLHDNDRRLADHFGGKLHLGFIEIREKLEKLRVRMSWSRSMLLCYEYWLVPQMYLYSVIKTTVKEAVCAAVSNLVISFI